MTHRKGLLTENLPEIISGIQRGYIATRFQKSLADCVTQAVEAAEGRRRSALERSQERSRRKRQAARDTVTHLLAERPDLSLDEAVTITHTRLRTLKQPVSLPVILDELQTLNFFGSETAPGTAYSSTPHTS